MSNTKTEYRGNRWTINTLDYLLQKIEIGEQPDEALHETMLRMHAICRDEMTCEDYINTQNILLRIRKLLPAAGVFGAVAWIDEDIEQELENAEIEITDDHIAAVKQRAMKRDRLREAQIDAGWAVIRACIDELYGKEA